MNDPVNKTVGLIKTHWSLLLMLSAIFLFATKTSFNIPIYIMAAIGLYRLSKNRELQSAPEIHLIYILFFSLWLSFQSVKENKTHHLPWLICILIVTLPYNAGSAFYSSYWSSLTWWIILISACFIFSSQDKSI